MSNKSLQSILLHAWNMIINPCYYGTLVAIYEWYLNIKLWLLFYYYIYLITNRNGRKLVLCKIAETWAILILPKFQADTFSFHNQFFHRNNVKGKAVAISNSTWHQASLTVGEACWWQAFSWPGVFTVCAAQAQLSCFPLWSTTCIWRSRTLLRERYVQRAILKEQTTVIVESITCRLQKWK